MCNIVKLTLCLIGSMALGLGCIIADQYNVMGINNTRTHTHILTVHHKETNSRKKKRITKALMGNEIKNSEPVPSIIWIFVILFI